MKNLDGATLELGVVCIEVTKELTSAVLQKGAENKMVNALYLAWMLKNRGFLSPNTMVMRGLDKLIRCKYVRYYNGQGGRVFGMTKLGWERWNKHSAAISEVAKQPVVVEQLAVAEPTVVANKVKCEHCGRFFSKYGIGRHRAACKAKVTQSA